MPSARGAAQAEQSTDARVDDLIARVERLEESLAGVLTGKVAELSQEEKDRQTLAKRPNSYPEAVEFKAAQERQTEREADRQAGKARADKPAVTPPA